MPRAAEVIGLNWERRIEQGLLTHFAEHRLASNGEIIREPSRSDVMSTMAVIIRKN